MELGRSRGHFLVDLCRPGHMTACLRTFQETIHCNDDNWDAHFGVWSQLCVRPAARCLAAAGTPQQDTFIVWKSRYGPEHIVASLASPLPYELYADARSNFEAQS